MRDVDTRRRRQLANGHNMIGDRRAVPPRAAPVLLAGAKQQNNQRTSITRYLLVLVLVFLFATFVPKNALFSGSESVPGVKVSGSGSKFAVVIDAGSTGTRWTRP